MVVFHVSQYITDDTTSFDSVLLYYLGYNPFGGNSVLFPNFQDPIRKPANRQNIYSLSDK